MEPARARSGSGRLATSRPPRGRSCLAFGACLLALALTLVALFLDFVTLTTSDYTATLLTALACAGASLLLVGALWRRVPLGGRLIGLLAVLGDLWVLVDALRRLWAGGAR